MMNPLERFSPATQAWFGQAFPEPTPAQSGAWDAISQGSNALVIAPTGSGKTLAAFLWSIDRLAHDPIEPRTTRVLYISPLKALAVDVERNLRAPLVGITQAAKLLGAVPPDVSVAVRSGDTPAGERARMLRNPPDILITTPESLYLMLTSQARETLRNVETVIVDEVHAVAATKRGSHLAVSLERLDLLLEKPAQRIGLSATVRPPEEVARFLAGSAPVQVVAPESAKRFDLRVVVPIEDMTELGTTAVTEGATSGARAQGSIWPHVEERIVDQILEHRSTIVFSNSRRLAERLTARLNELYAERLGIEFPPEEVPADLIAQSGRTAGIEPILARAHHGSVSKDQRSLIEDDLKSGRLRCVVATSSLELGIDMGAVDLVIQVEAPPSVASGLQRVGRAGHQVGEISKGVLYPKHRADLLHSAVTSGRMSAGLIEELVVPQNPLDILAQQTVAAVALEELSVDDWFDTVRRSAPFATLPRSLFEATLDLLSGLYPSDEFAELRPRIIWNRVDGTIKGRPGAQRLAVISGGTIPDRGMFGVFMVGGGGRVGELDEEMVYESRVGDVFSLGATSWQIEQITHDRVLVSPAYGRPGRVPFWKGDSLGRPAELGRAIGAFTHELSTASEADARAQATAAGLDDYAVANLVAFVAEQKEATGHVPTDKTFVVERFRDELGDWRVVLHSPLGLPVHSPWALAVGARLRERLGIDGAAVASDDGVILRIPDTDADPPGADLFFFEPEEIGDLVTEEVGGSALFASRFRENAARALLLPNYNPSRRSPLWQQRQRSSQLLSVASRYPSFPIVLETVREVLQDVYDLPGLTGVLADLAARRIRIVETETEQASPFARSLLFGYVAAFMYEGDSPLAERRAAALSLDPQLLTELLGRAELRELLDAEVIAQTELELQRLAPDRRARDAEGIVDLLRMLGPLSVDEVADRFDVEEYARRTGGGVATDPQGLVRGLLEELQADRRVLAATIAGGERWHIIEDTARLRDGLGIPVPLGVPVAFLDPVPDPLGDLVARHARTHGPFTAVDVAQRFGIGTAVATEVLRRLESQRRVAEGEFRPDSTGAEWCDTEVLRRLRARSLAALRHEVEPVTPDTLARFVPAWQHVTDQVRGIDGVVQVIEQLAGVALPASAWESLILPSRVRDYSPAMLDELTASGEVIWSGRGTLPGSDGWMALHLADTLALTLPEPEGLETTELQGALLDTLAGGGGFFFRQLSTAVSSMDDKELVEALWELAWAGLVTNDTLTPVRAYLGGPTRARTVSRRGIRHLAPPKQAGPPTVAGRWSLLPLPEPDVTVRAHAAAEQLLERHGVVTRGAVANEGVRGGFATMYKVLSSLEDTGRVRRGYFVEGLGAAQFATGAIVDRLRSFSADPDAARPYNAVTLAATDPANPYGAALKWPASERGHRPGRKAGALVVLVDGRLTVYVERGGKSVLTFDDDNEALAAAASSLAATVHRSLRRLRVDKVDGEFVIGTPLGHALADAGFGVTPQGLRLIG
ncbi:ATP-dependent helicase [Cryobacterium sp. BB307]|uniref:ATP-dependent helicase n=1 Tax=Cryobacterium sp. BB307 TaxID=2716317 RepID=UPI00144786B4|nr:ATP-dependent helicase [Cryobacterium sp. BB307]